MTSAQQTEALGAAPAVGGASVGAQEPLAEELILVRATIHLPGLPRGAEALVDINSAYIQGLLGAGWLWAIGAPDEFEEGGS